MIDKMRIVFTCGGTGGHIFPAIAIAEAFLKKYKKDVRIIFIGSDTGMEKNIIKDYGFEYYSITARPFLRKFTFKNILNIFFIINAFFKSFLILRKIKPDFVIGTGGYVSFPVILVAIFIRKKTCIHEPNVYPGLANRILAKFVDIITVGFSKTKDYFPKKKVYITGNPVRESILNIKRNFARKKFKLDLKKPTLLIMPGSRAAHNINEVLLNGFVDLIKAIKEIQIIWMTGEKDYENIKNKLKGYKNVRVFNFIKNAGIAYAASDAGILRAGASTLSEIVALNFPAILIPYPYATDNHQEKNAQIFEKNKMAIVIKDKELTSEKLIKNIKIILNKKNNNALRKKMKGLFVKNSAEKIRDILLKVA